MKKTMKLALCLIMLTVALSAGAKVEKSQILGIWTSSQTTNGINVVSTYDFKDDNTVTQILVVNGTNPQVNIIADGTVSYKLSDDTLTFKFSAKDFNFTLFQIEGLPDEYVEMAKNQMMGQMVNMEQKLTDVQVEGDTLTAKFNGETVTLQRK